MYSNNNNLNPPEFDLTFLNKEPRSVFIDDTSAFDLPQNIKNYFNNDTDFIKILYLKKKYDIIWGVFKIFQFSKTKKIDVFHFIGISMVSCLLSLILYSKNMKFFNT